MPVIRSAKKQMRVSLKNRERNENTKSEIKNAIKAVAIAVKNGEKDLAELVSKAQSAIDKAAKKNVIHKNKAARKKAQIHALAKSVHADPSEKIKAAPKKAAAKKGSVKKVSKKTVAKKTVAAKAKKPAVKKTIAKKVVKKAESK